MWNDPIIVIARKINRIALQTIPRQRRIAGGWVFIFGRLEGTSLTRSCIDGCSCDDIVSASEKS